MRDLRKRAADISAAEAGFCRQARARLEHLCEAEAALARHGPPGAPGASARGRSGEGSTLVETNERSLEFMLADHVLRAGHLDTARLAAAEGRLEDLVDLEIFSQARGVTEALRGGGCRSGTARRTPPPTLANARRVPGVSTPEEAGPTACSCM